MNHRKPKKSDSASKLILEEIIGLTSKNGNGLASNHITGDCMYLAGCVVVVYNVNTAIQTHLVVPSRTPKPLNCVASLHSPSKIVAAGESGHQPAVIVWDYSTQIVVSELKVHRFGVSCIAFSPDGKHLVSIGFPHDGYLCLWDWKSGTMVTKIKSSSSCTGISCVSFSSDARVFVTSGKKHLKFWTLGSSTRPRSNVTSLPTLDGKSATLGCQKGNSFVSVVSATSSSANLVGGSRAVKLYPIYALTDAGVLCLIKSGFSVTRWEDLEVEKSFAMSISNKLIACACTNGVVKLFTVETIKYVGSLQYLKAKEHHESTDTSETKPSEKAFHSDPALPDAIACQFSSSEKLVVIYENHSLYIWDVDDVFQVSRCCVLVSHSACIWDVKNLPCENMHDPALACVARGCCGGISFATCSTDGTIRLWDLLLQPEGNETSVDTDKASALHLAGAGIFERDIVESAIDTKGFRSMAVSSDGIYMAAGDSQGNLHLYNLHTSDYTCIQNAHDSEILSLTFNLPSKNHVSKDISENHYLLASGGRDRMIHLYDVKRGLEVIGSMDDHSAAVTSVKLTFDGHKIVSCSADRSLVFRDVSITDTECKISRSHHQMASLGTIYDMVIDPSMEVAVTVGQDKKINAFSISSGKLLKTFKQQGSFGEPIKVTLDPSSSYLVCSYSNKSMCIYDFTNGELVTQAVGHGEVITGIIFLPDCKHLVSVGGEGCIFVWRLPSTLSTKMQQRMMENAGSVSPRSMQKPLILRGGSLYDESGYHCNTKPNGGQNKNVDVKDVFSQEQRSQDVSTFEFSISRLPKWAQAKVASEGTLSLTPEVNMFQNKEPEPDTSLMSESGEPELDSSSMSESGEPEHSSSLLSENVVILTPKGLDQLHSPLQPILESNELCLTNISNGSSGSDASENSPLPQGTSSFAMDSRWHTVHTVYHELLDSPDAADIKVEMVPFSASTFLNNPSLEVSRNHGDCIDRTEENPVPTNYIPVKSFPGPSNQDGALVHNPRTSSAASAEQMNPDVQKVPMQTIKDGDSERTIQDDDIFSQNFSNLSSVLKLEGRRLSVRRNYSARFVVRRDHVTGCKRLLEALNQPSHGEVLNIKDTETTSRTSSRPPLKRVVEDCQTSDHDPMKVEGINEIHQRKDSSVQIQERINECKKALFDMDTAADTALQLFGNLQSLIPSECTPELYDQAATLIPRLIKKINALADLVQSRKKDSCSNAKMEET
ncbi:hypothetical protein C5167_047095 [Papaver somniferum]|uniref:Anaphase-promoting complex subunit 4 WD40 domain-containing protein n=1 Tax=Papaver somniferum TaxID=3469 RepID=A0A4Y7LJG0_PAPSO|nr:mitogen-activated protein kinase-binding protein 1 [Papaver somniferum]RZC84309.1 hypothetical protein C5167_047095 [Papaver somniferum]